MEDVSVKKEKGIEATNVSTLKLKRKIESILISFMYCVHGLMTANLMDDLLKKKIINQYVT